MREKLTGQGPIAWPCFMLGSTPIKHYIHSHNVNYPPFRMTERSIELALADIYLSKHYPSQIVEIGATSPYYWPHRISTIVDPTDTHPLVTIKENFLNFNIQGKAVLSISTFEHIGLPDYGLVADEAAMRQAMNQLLETAGDFLVTIPGGYNPALDQYILNLASLNVFKLHIWHRLQYGNDWFYVDCSTLTVNNFTYGPFWANTLIALHRGEDLV